MKLIIKKFVYTSLITVGFLNAISVSAQTPTTFATFEIGQALIDGYDLSTETTTPFTTITFDRPFENIPNVFTMTPEFDGADDPCTIRIRSVSTTGFEATCLEPSSAIAGVTLDPVSPDIPFEYIAIQDGGVTVPLADGPGNAVFQSSCQVIDDQQRRGAGTSFADFDFSSAFTNPPALIAQVQSVFNNVAGEPEFLDVSIRNVTNDDADIAIELAETRTTDLALGENICILAVERNGCQSLDFSSLGGPTTPVVFEALTTAANIQGHNNMPCDSASFTNMCFGPATPLVLAKQNTRNGGDGGFLRSCDVSTTAATFVYDEDQIRDSERSHTGSEAISIFAFGEAFTTPVTLNSAEVSLFGRNATFKWETTAETFHLGFNLWGESADGWVQLNRRLISGDGADTSQKQSYQQTIRLSRQQSEEITEFGLSSVDNTGYEEFYGPFTEGQSYGEEANNEPVDWAQTRKTFEQSMRERGFAKVNNRWRRLSEGAHAQLANNQLGVDQAMFDIQVQANGIHSFKGSDLIALNPSWNRTLLRNIALTLNGQAIPRHIVSQNRRLDNDDQIIFNAQAPQGDDTPFLEHYTYRLTIDRSNAVDANTFDGTLPDALIENDESTLSTTALLEQTLTSRKLHSAGLTTGDPWYDTRLLSTGRTASAEYNVDFEQPIQSDQGGQLDVLLFGGLDLPDEGDDHHVQVYVNEQQVSDLRFDGLIGQQLRLSLDAGLLKQTGNTVRVDVVGDTGFRGDIVFVDEITIAAFSALSNDTRPALDFAQLPDAIAYKVSRSAAEQNQVYAYTTTGLLSSVKATSGNGATAFASLPFQIGSNTQSTLRYAVGSVDDWPTPSDISVVVGENLHSQENDYLIVAHPTFMGEELDEFVTFKTELGYNVLVVDWLEIVNTYGYGNNTPAALNNFLAAANSLYRTENVLLVGGHTYDYFGISNDDIVNYIPSHYRPVSVFEYTATDNPYTDLNGDNLPEFAIGRWPVRSITDLQTIIKKTKDWHQNRENSPYQSAYLLAQATDSQSLDFTEQLTARVKTPLSQLGEIDGISALSLDNVPEGIDDTVAFTRTSLAEQINGGTDLVSFSGHGSPTAWGFQNAINTTFIQGLENQGEPVLLMPLACYITHYESVSTNTLAHQWLFAGDIGAAAIHGASVLGAYRDNGLFAERYLIQSKTSQTIGEAILKAKMASGYNNPILHNWALLGDPTLPIR